MIGGKTYNASDFVAYKIGWLIDVGALHEEVVLETSSKDRQHQVATGFHVRISYRLAPHFDAICAKSILG